MLEIAGATSGYGETIVLHGLDLSLRAGTVHALLGRNGVGKTTTLRTIMGLLTLRGGAIALDGASLGGRRPFDVARRGIAYVPETRDVFATLTVRENLALAGRLAPPGGGDWPMERVVEFFPNLKARLNNGGAELSGGEQQMLAIGRALMACPRVLLLDEPTEGLAPIIIQQLFGKLRELKAAGQTILLVEQNFAFAAGLADEITLMSRGRQVWHGTPAALRADDATHARYLGV